MGVVTTDSMTLWQFPGERSDEKFAAVVCGVAPQAVPGPSQLKPSASLALSGRMGCVFRKTVNAVAQRLGHSVICQQSGSFNTAVPQRGKTGVAICTGLVLQDTSHPSRDILWSMTS